jgi:hypothetical protein
MGHRPHIEAAKSRVYVTPPIGEGPGPFTLTESYKAEALAKQRIALAGARLSNLIEAGLK